MLDKVKTYLILFGTLLLAIIAILFQRRGETIKDLQREQLTKKLDQKLDQIKTAVREGEKDYESTLNSYRNLRNAYRKLNAPKS